MCIIRAFPDPNGDFVAPARVFRPKSSRSTSRSSAYHGTYIPSERSPRHSSYIVPPPPREIAAAQTVERSPRSSRYIGPPPVIVQEVAPKPTFLRPESPALATAQTSLRTPRRSTSRASVPPPVPEAPPAAHESHHHHHYHHYHHQNSQPESARGRSNTRHSSASRSSRTTNLSPRYSTSQHSRSTRSNPPTSATSDSFPYRGRNDRLSVELPQRSASTKSTKYLEQSRRKDRDPLILENPDGTRTRKYYYG